MADGERRLVFDTRGRRKHVVRVVYAILALLMGASLFLVVGPFNIGNLLGNNSTSNAAKISEERAERIEQKLRLEPTNEELLLALTRALIAAGKASSEINPETGAPVLTAEGRQNLEEAGVAWNRYTKQADPVNPSAAALMAGAFLNLAEIGTSYEEINKNVKAAAVAQRIAVKGRPSLGSYSTLAIYEYYAENFPAGDAAAKQAEAKASKSEVKELQKKLAEYRARGKSFKKLHEEILKEERKAGKESLQNPFGGLAGGSSSAGQ